MFDVEKKLEELYTNCKDEVNALSVLREIIEIQQIKKASAMSASEALYGFCGWLTTRPEKTVMSASDDAAPIAELIKRFCDENVIVSPEDPKLTKLKFPRVVKLLREL